MNKKLLAVALGAVSLISSTSNAADLGRRFGANGYINNMPLYFKDYNTRGNQHNRKVNKKRGQLRRDKRARNKTAAQTRKGYRERRAERIAQNKARLSSSLQTSLDTQNQPMFMSKQQAELELKRALLQKELTNIEKKRRGTF